MDLNLLYRLLYLSTPICSDMLFDTRHPSTLCHQVFWFLPSRQVWKMSYTHHTNSTEPQPPLTVEALDDSHQAAAQEAAGQLPPGAYGQVANPAGAVPGAIGMDTNTFYWNTVFMQVGCDA